MPARPPIRFDRHELAGAFGDIGTDLPLIAAMILAAGLHTPSVLIVFGLLQVASGLVYRMPMPVQPLKAMATLVIAQRIAGPVLLGAGLAIGVVMLLLSLTGVLDRLTRFIPKAVVRGLQLGLGLSLCLLAAKDYILPAAAPGLMLAGAAFLVVLLLIDRPSWPPALLLVAMGIAYALIIAPGKPFVDGVFGIHLPRPTVPSWDDIATGFVLLALPQIPLSLGNSIIATRQVSADLFPERPPLTARRIGITYGLMNLVNPFLGGIPTCHGSGGMVGHHTFGGRTGGSVVLYGSLYLLAGLFMADGADALLRLFPLPVLGVLLFFEGLGLMLFMRDTVAVPRAFVIAVLTGILAAGLPYGFAIAMLIGTAVHYSPLKLSVFSGRGGGAR